MAGPIKLRGVGPGRQEHPNFVVVLGVVVIQFDALTDFRGGDANNRVGVRVVVGWPLEDFDSQYALFELVGLTGQGARHNKPLEPRVSLAGME